MWTANIKSVDKNSDNLSVKISVDFTNGDVVNTIPFTISEPDSIKRIIANQINQYKKIDDFMGTQIIGDVDLTPPTPPVPVPPTQDELDKQDYLKKRQAVVQAKSDLELGLITQEEFNTIQSDAVNAKVGLKETPVSPLIP